MPQAPHGTDAVKEVTRWKFRVHSNIDCPQERRKIPNSILPSKGVRKRRKHKAKNQQKEGNNKNQK